MSVSPLTFVHRSHIDHNYSSNSGVVSTFLKLHKTFPGRRETPVRDEDYQAVHSEPLVLMENAALSSPHALNSTRTCAFFQLVRTPLPPFLRKETRLQLKVLRLLAAKQCTQLSRNSARPSHLMQAATPGLILLQAAQKKKLISLDLKREKSRCVPGSTASNNKLRLQGVNWGWKCLPLRGEHSQLTGRLSECLGTSVEETVTGSRRKLSLKHSCPFLLHGGSYRGSLAAHQAARGAKIMMK